MARPARTVRLDLDVDDALEAMAKTAGVTVNALIQAGIENSTRRFCDHGSKLPSEWTNLNPEIRATYEAVFERALEITKARKSRRGILRSV